MRVVSFDSQSSTGNYQYAMIHIEPEKTIPLEELWSFHHAKVQKSPRMTLEQFNKTDCCVMHNDKKGCTVSAQKCTHNDSELNRVGEKEPEPDANCETCRESIMKSIRWSNVPMANNQTMIYYLTDTR